MTNNIQDILAQNLAAANKAVAGHPGLTKEILRCEVGSTAHGCSVSEQDDLDMMGVYVESPHNHFAVAGRSDSILHRTAEVRTGKHDAKSEPGDVDLTLHNVQKFCWLASKGNPSILMMFFSKKLDVSGAKDVVANNMWGQWLRDAHGLFFSRSSVASFLGYMKAQRERLNGERGQKDVNRPELVEKYGFDTKYAYHMVRLGVQGLEYATTGKVSIPVSDQNRDLLVGIRTGRYNIQQVNEIAKDLEARIEYELDNTKSIPAKPEYNEINNLVRDIYIDVWEYYELLG